MVQLMLDRDDIFGERVLEQRWGRLVEHAQAAALARLPEQSIPTGGASSSSSHQGAPTPNAPATGGDSSSPALPATGGTPAEPQRVCLARLKARAALGNPEVAQRFADALVHNRDGQ